MLTANVSGPFSLDLESNNLEHAFENPPVELENRGVKTPITTADEARRQTLRETVLLASNLVSNIEQMNYMYAVDALQGMHPTQRLNVARTMLGINKQHRRIIETLPVISLAVLKADGKEFLYHIQITYANAVAVPTVCSFTFDPEELNAKLMTSS